MSNYMAAMLNDDMNLSKCQELTQVYGKPSKKKLESFEAIKAEMRECGGWDLYITSHNGWNYTCCYKYVDQNGKTHVVYHSRDSRKDFIVDSFLKTVVRFSDYTNKYYGGI